jgi:tetratricopeptide (TPR) repeat protein
MGALSCGLLFLAGDLAFSRRVGWIAGVVLALYPPAIFFDGIVQKASLGGVLVTLLLYLAVRADRRPRRTSWFAVGIALGLLMLTREETLLLAPVLLGWIVWSFRDRPLRERAGFVGAWLGGAALVLIPVAARNAHVGGEFVLTTSQAGSNFYIGNHAGANGSYTPLRPGRSNTPLERIDARELAELGAGRKLSAAEVSAYWFDQSFTWIRANPLAWGRLLLRKARLLFNADEIADSEDQAYYAQYSWWLRWSTYVLHFGIVLPFAAVGLWISRARPGPTRLLLLLLATLCVGVVAFYVFARYRYPVVPFAILFAAAGAEWIIATGRQREWRSMAVPAVIFAGVAVLANVRATKPDAQLAMAYSNAGAVLIEAREYRAAEAQLRRSLELSDDPDTWFNIARAALLSGNKEAAAEALQRALAKRPRDPAYLLQLGRTQLAQGDARGAIDAVQRSIEAWPRAPEAWAFLGSIHAQRGDWPAVVDVSSRALDANPNDLQVGLSLAWLLSTVPDARLRNPGRALEIAQRFEKQTAGRDFRALDVLAVAYAANGRFGDATQAAERAIALAEAARETAFAAEIRQRLQMYQRGQPLGR